MAKSVAVQYDFPFFAHLRDFYVQNRGRIRQHYRELTRRYLDFNDPDPKKISMPSSASPSTKHWKCTCF